MHGPFNTAAFGLQRLLDSHSSAGLSGLNKSQLCRPVVRLLGMLGCPHITLCQDRLVRGEAASMAHMRQHDPTSQHMPTVGHESCYRLHLQGFARLLEADRQQSDGVILHVRVEVAIQSLACQGQGTMHWQAPALKLLRSWPGAHGSCMLSPSFEGRQRILKSRLHPAQVCPTTCKLCQALPQLCKGIAPVGAQGKILQRTDICWPAGGGPKDNHHNTNTGGLPRM